MKLKIVEVNGTQYIAQVERSEEGTIVALTKAARTSEFVQYLCEKNAGNLKRIEISGTNTVTVTDFNTAAEAKFKMLKMQMKLVKANTLRALENEALRAGKFKLQ